MKKAIVFLLISVFLFSCGATDKQEFKRTATDTIYTSVHVALDVIGGEYGDFTARKIRFDNTKLNPADSTRVQWFRDSAYEIHIDVPVLDSAGKNPKLDSNGKVMKRKMWNFLEKELVLEDYQRKWPITTKQGAAKQ